MENSSMAIKQTHIVYDFHSDGAAYFNALKSGAVIEITPATFDYFLGVLPPVYMSRKMLIEGAVRNVAFGFAEGCEPITAFWFADRGAVTRYFCQRTLEMNPSH
jgi:hypothetical protein